MGNAASGPEAPVWSPPEYRDEFLWKIAVVGDMGAGKVSVHSMRRVLELIGPLRHRC